MFYQPKDGHGLPHNPFKAIVTPRPIGWISTRDAQGRDNLAPYSFFNAVADRPPQVIFAENGRKSDRPKHKDSVANVAETGVFCVNIVGLAQVGPMNLSSESLPAGMDEFAHAGLEREECRMIPCPRVLGTPAALECRLVQIVPLAAGSGHLVLGEVVGIHIDEAVLRNGRFDVTTYTPVARMGYRDYAKVESLFELTRPDD